MKDFHIEFVQTFLFLLIFLQFNNFVRIHGNGGNLDGTKILKRTVSSVMTTNLLSQFAWTGKTNRKDVKKIALKDYQQVLLLIYETILAADSSYSRFKYDEDMVQKILKYAYTGQTINVSSTASPENSNNYDQTSANSIALGQNMYYSGSTGNSSNVTTLNHVYSSQSYITHSQPYQSNPLYPRSLEECHSESSTNTFIHL